MKLQKLMTPLWMLCAMAAPAWCSTSFAFSTSTPGGSLTAIGSTLHTMTGVNFNVLTITDSPLDPNGVLTYAITGENFQLSGSDLILTGNIGNYTSCTGTCSAADNLSLSGAILYEVALSDTTTTVFNANKNLSLSINSAATTITDAALDAAVGITGPTVTTNVGSSGVTAAGSGAISGGYYPFTAASESLNTSVTMTPEPVSLLTAGGGLLLVGCLARRRRRTNPAQ